MHESFNEKISLQTGWLLSHWGSFPIPEIYVETLSSEWASNGVGAEWRSISCDRGRSFVRPRLRRRRPPPLRVSAQVITLTDPVSGDWQQPDRTDRVALLRKTTSGFLTTTDDNTKQPQPRLIFFPLCWFVLVLVGFKFLCIKFNVPNCVYTFIWFYNCHCSASDFLFFCWCCGLLPLVTCLLVYFMCLE